MNRTKNTRFSISYIILLAIASLFIWSGAAYAAGPVQLQFNSMSMDQPQLEFKVIHPDNAVDIRIFQDGVVAATAVPVAGSTETTVSVTTNSQAHVFTAEAYINGLSLGVSDPVAFDGGDYKPNSVTWNMTKEVNVIDGRLFVNGTVDPNATVVYLAMNGKIAYRTTPSNGTYKFRNVALPKRYNWIQIIGQNGWGKTTTKSVQAVYFKINHKYKQYIVIDKSELTLFYVNNGEVTDELPVAIGTPATPTPAGSFIIGNKLVTSASGDWGARRMVLHSRDRDGKYRHHGYSLHGTNRPSSIGKMASHGCIRLYNEDAIMIYDRVSKGTEVFIVP